MLLNFLVYITIPVVLQYTGIVLAVGSFLIYVGAIVGLATQEEYFWEEVGKNSKLIFQLIIMRKVFYVKKITNL